MYVRIGICIFIIVAVSSDTISLFPSPALAVPSSIFCDGGGSGGGSSAGKDDDDDDDDYDDDYLHNTQSHWAHSGGNEKRLNVCACVLFGLGKLSYTHSCRTVRVGQSSLCRPVGRWRCRKGNSNLRKKQR